MSSIFLSHSHKDREFARRLGNWLRNYGARVWIDEAEMKVGDSLLRKIEDGIAGAEFLGVVLSPHSVKSEWVRRELEIALTDEIGGRRVKVLPLLHRTCEIPAFLRGKVYADFRRKKGFEAAVARVAAALGFEEADRRRVSGRQAIHRQDFERQIQKHFAPRVVEVEFYEDGSGLDFIKVWNTDGTFELYSYSTRPTDDDLVNTIFSEKGGPRIRGVEIIEDSAVPRRESDAMFRELCSKYGLPNDSYPGQWGELSEDGKKAFEEWVRFLEARSVVVFLFEETV